MWMGLVVKAHREWSGKWERLSEELWREMRSPWRLWQVELWSTYEADGMTMEPTKNE